MIDGTSVTINLQSGSIAYRLLNTVEDDAIRSIFENRMWRQAYLAFQKCGFETITLDKSSKTFITEATAPITMPELAYLYRSGFKIGFYEDKKTCRAEAGGAAGALANQLKNLNRKLIVLKKMKGASTHVIAIEREIELLNEKMTRDEGTSASEILKYWMEARFVFPDGRVVFYRLQPHFTGTYLLDTLGELVGRELRELKVPDVADGVIIRDSITPFGNLAEALNHSLGAIQVIYM